MMDSCNNGKNPLHRRQLHHHCHHHHHHHHLFYVSPECPLHCPLVQPHNHSPKCSSFSTSHHQQLLPPDHVQTNQIPDHDDHTEMMQDEVVKPVEEEDEEPVFVLTDEWREFFAKSEAKRRLAKNEAKKMVKI